MEDDRTELVEIITDGAGISRNEADHIAGMIIAAGFTRQAYPKDHS